MKDAQMWDELKKLYEKSSPQEKNAFADVVAEKLMNVKPPKITVEEPKTEYKGSVRFSTKKKERLQKKDKIYGLLSDDSIAKLCKNSSTPLIEPFADRKISKDGMFSFGLEPYGYTARLAESFVSLTDINTSSDQTYIDPKNLVMAKESLKKTSPIVIGPHETILAMTAEYFNFPDYIVGKIYAKSSYCRSGIHYLFSVVEPGFEGRLTIGLYNTNSKKTIVYPGEGFIQIQFERPFAMAKSYYFGRYQHSTKPTHTKGDHSDE